MRGGEPIDLAGAAPGSRLDLDLQIEAPEGSIDIPVTILRGSAPGARLTLIGGVHGDEFDGPCALAHLIQTLDPTALAGTVIVAPVVNIPAFRACSRLSPLDGLNLNRVFPGRPDGSITERIAYAVIESLVRGSDAVFSLHGSSAWGLLEPWVEFQHVDSPIGRASHAMAVAAGFPSLFPLPYGYDPGILLFAAHDLGIPCIEGERGGNASVSPSGAVMSSRRTGSCGTSASRRATSRRRRRPSCSTTMRLPPRLTASGTPRFRSGARCVRARASAPCATSVAAASNQSSRLWVAGSCRYGRGHPQPRKTAL